MKRLRGHLSLIDIVVLEQASQYLLVEYTRWIITNSNNELFH